jgi:hypothetical protein
MHDSVITISTAWYFYNLSLLLFVGKIVTFSFLIAPIVHELLEKEQAAKLLRAFFPRYYKLGISCAVMALICAFVIMYGTPFPKMRYPIILWGFILFSETYAVMVLAPRLEATRELRSQGDVQATQKWESAHKFSVKLNVANLLAGLILIGLTS